MIDTDIDFSRLHYPCAYSYKHNRETFPVYKLLFLHECAIHLILGRKCFRDARSLFVIDKGEIYAHLSRRQSPRPADPRTRSWPSHSP